MELLTKLWLWIFHWVRLEAFDTEDQLQDALDLIQRQHLPTKVRACRTKEGKLEYVLYVKDADRDYARYCTGWRPF